MVTLLCCLAWLMMAMPAWADGIIIPIPVPPRPPEPIKSLAIRRHRVTVEIGDQVATTHVDQVFYNELPYDIEGDYIFPLPEGAAISQFAMWVDGQRLQAQVLERDEAQRIYEDIVRQRRDPALLEYVGRNAFRARIYPIPARGEKRIEIEYTEVLSRDGDLVSYRYPLNTEKFSTKPLEQVSVSVRIHAREGIGAVYSPSHDVAVVRKDAFTADVSYEEKGVTPNQDYVLYYSLQDDRLGANVISYRPPGEDGYFLMLLSPGQVVSAERAIPKDVHLVLDVSGSMRGEKLVQAKNAARYVLDNLNPDDRFNLLAFGTGTRLFAQRPQPVSQRDGAHAFIGDLQAGGGTNIDRALAETLRQTEKGRPQIVVFLTDGLATEGETNTAKILGHVAELAHDAVRIFAFGVGYDVNTTLLDTMSQEHHGASSYVRPDEDIERAVSSFYDKISLPVLADLLLDFGSIQVEDAYPYPLPDLFAGSQIVMVGRYRQPGDTTITLTGAAEGAPQRFAFENVRFRASGGSDFIPRLWATRKIGYLLTQIRLHGADRELINEIVSLSVRFGIVTPYTSFLVDESEDALSSEGRRVIAERELSVRSTAASPDGVGGAMAPLPYGQAAVEQSIAQNQMRVADRVAAPTAEQLRMAGDKAFVLRQGVWTDTTFDPDLTPTERIALGSERYFRLLRNEPGLAPYLAVDAQVVVVWKGRAYRILPPGGVESEEVSGPSAPPQPAQPATLTMPTARPTPGASVVAAPTSSPTAAPTLAPPKRAPLWRLILEWVRGALS
jgi:Ca-activated chloride channel family protein